MEFHAAAGPALRKPIDGIEFRLGAPRAPWRRLRRLVLASRRLASRRAVDVRSKDVEEGRSSADVVSERRQAVLEG